MNTKLFSAGGYEFNFEYDVHASIQNEGRTTTCIVTKGDKLICKGNSHCHKKDNFVKATGRKIALTRAIELLQLDKESRKEMWNKYFEKVKK
jgi:hypothetical protein